MGRHSHGGGCVVFFLCCVSHVCWNELFFSFDFSFFLSLSGCFVFLTLPRVMSVWSSAKGENGAGCHRIPENIPSWLRTKLYWTPRRPDDVKTLVMVWILWHHWGPWSEPQAWCDLWNQRSGALSPTVSTRPQKLRQQSHTGLWELWSLRGLQAHCSWSPSSALTARAARTRGSVLPKLWLTFDYILTLSLQFQENIISSKIPKMSSQVTVNSSMSLLDFTGHSYRGKVTTYMGA